MTTLIVGLGSDHGDDRAGWLVADFVCREMHGGRSVSERPAVRRAVSPLDLLDWLDGVEHLVVCDACEPAGQPGRWHRWTWPAPQLDRLKHLGSHDYSVAGVLGLAETLGALPARVVIFAVEAGAEAGVDRVAPEVAAAVPAVAAAVCREWRGIRDE